MRVKTIKINFNDAYLLPFSDFHVGDKGFTKKSEQKVKGYVKWIKDTPNAYVILNGDLVNCATMRSPSSPFDENMTLPKQINKVVSLLEPIKERILGAVDGTHENNLIKYVSYSPTISICDRLGIEYMGSSAIYILRLGTKNNHTSRKAFTVFTHHTTGGGRTEGSRLNRVILLRDIVPNCDAYIGSHSHTLLSCHKILNVLNTTTAKLDTIRQLFCISGGYLEWNESYAERMMLAPAKIGSPRIHFMVKRKRVDGKETVSKDTHISV